MYLFKVRNMVLFLKCVARGDDCVDFVCIFSWWILSGFTSIRNVGEGFGTPFVGKHRRLVCLAINGLDTYTFDLLLAAFDWQGKPKWEYLSMPKGQQQSSLAVYYTLRDQQMEVVDGDPIIAGSSFFFRASTSLLCFYMPSKTTA
jgi:hypothetical protein